MTTETKAMPRKRRKQIPLTYVVALVPVAAALNIVGGYINTALKLPIFLDMIGTAVVAIVLGPWWGALVGAVTNIVNSFISGPISLPFAACNVIGALVWGYAHQWGWMKKNLEFLPGQCCCSFLCFPHRSSDLCFRLRWRNRTLRRYDDRSIPGYGSEPDRFGIFIKHPRFPWQTRSSQVLWHWRLLKLCLKT